MMSSHPLSTRRSRQAEEVLRGWRARGFHSDERIGWILEDRARSAPERPAVIMADGVVDYATLQSTASAVARTLVSAGVREGDVVCWMLPTGADAIAVASAIWRIGAISSPLVPIYGRREITNAIDQVRPAAIITNAEYRGRSLADEFDDALDEVGHSPRARLLCAGRAAGWVDAAADGPGALPDSVAPGRPEAPALVLFTSGTEAAPKGALHSTAGLVHEVRSCISDWGVTFRDTMFMASPMTHITGLLQGFLIPARVGGAALLMERWEPAQAVELIERWGATYMAGATPFLRELLTAYRSSGRDASSLRQYCCGGAAVPPDLIEAADELGVAAYRAWGMTEMPTATVSNELDPLEVRAHTDGRPSVGVELRVIADDGTELATGETGRLQLRGPEMMLGYVDASRDRDAFTPDGWLETGDVGSVDERGYVTVSGRNKDIINRGGEKFSVQEIAALVSAHPEITAATVIAVPGGRLGERIGAVVVCERPIAVEELGEFVVAQGTARQKRPELVVVVNEIPTNATGKVDRAAVLRLFADA